MSSNTGNNTPGAGPLFQTQAFTPTPEQLAIQTASARSLLIEANAGAAKTTTLALSMAESWQRGTLPDAFLALVHTDTACEALRAALKKIGVPAPVRQRMRVATFEQFCTHLLADPSARAARVPVLTTPEQLRPHVWQAVQQVENNAQGGRWQSALQLPAQGDSGFVEEFLAVAARLKGTLADEHARDGQAASPDYAEALGVDFTLLCVFLAGERLRLQGLANEPLFRGPHDATYDLARALHLGALPADYPRWPVGVRSLCVDEMHDMNQATFTVLAALLKSTFSLFCGVGDRDQVLFGSGGADARFMQGAITQATGRAVLRLPLTPSHRFGKRLATKVGRLAAKPYASAAAHDTAVSLQSYQDSAACVALVMAELAHWRASKRRPRMDQFAVLLRHAHLSVGIENALIAAEVPYTLSGFDSYLLRPEVLLVRGLLAVATDNFHSVAEPRTRNALVHALLFFCGAHIVTAGREDASQQVLLADAIRDISDNPLLLKDYFRNQILPNVEPAMRRRLLAAVAVAQQPPAPDMLQRVLDALEMDALIQGALVSRQRRQEARGNIAGLCAAARGFSSAQAYFLHLNKAEQSQAALRSTASMVLASIAQVKGLEFEHVVVPFLEHDIFPAPQGRQDEEQNTLYVAMTRARSQLTLLAHSTRPSSFVAQLGYAMSSTPAQQTAQTQEEIDCSAVAAMPRTG